jgi:hypothetical protein
LPDLIRQSINFKTTLLAKMDGCAGLRRAEGASARRRVKPAHDASAFPDAAQRAALRGVVRCKAGVQLA